MLLLQRVCEAENRPYLAGADTLDELYRINTGLPPREAAFTRRREWNRIPEERPLFLGGIIAAIFPFSVVPTRVTLGAVGEVRDK